MSLLLGRSRRYLGVHALQFLYTRSEGRPQARVLDLNRQLRPREALIKSHMRDRSAFVPCIPARSIGRQSTKTVRTSIGTKALRSLVRGESYWVASAAASAALRALPRYLPWLRRDALHPSAPDATRVARLNQRFPSGLPGTGPRGNSTHACAGAVCSAQAAACMPCLSIS